MIKITRWWCCPERFSIVLSVLQEYRVDPLLSYHLIFDRNIVSVDLNLMKFFQHLAQCEYLIDGGNLKLHWQAAMSAFAIGFNRTHSTLARMCLICDREAAYNCVVGANLVVCLFQDRTEDPEVWISGCDFFKTSYYSIQLESTKITLNYKHLSIYRFDA